MNQVLNIKLVARIISFNVFIVSGSFVACSSVAWIYAESLAPFIYSFVISLVIGLILFFASTGVHRNDDIQKKEAYFIVTASWLLLGLMGSFPFVISGAIHPFIDALFESVSGFTTTGSSILTDIESLPKSILFWRSLTHWIGGIGIIMLVIIILPSLKIGGYHLFTSESSLQDKIKPRIKQVGIRLLMIYITLTVAEIILLLFGKMPLFDSICHSFGTIATGGFSTRNSSIGEYSSYIQYVIMIFMLLSGTNFIIHYYLVIKKFGKIRRNEEFRFYLTIIFIVGVIATAALFFGMDKPLEVSFREGFFQVISIITTTGFSTTDYLMWPTFAWILIFMSMFLGGCTGSTAGGIKMFRHLIVYKSVKSFGRRAIHPHAVIPVRVNRKRLASDASNSALSFIILYFCVFIIGTILLVATGVDGQSASSSVATCMAGIGPGIGTVGPAGNFAQIPGMGKILLIFLMIIGRLEIYTVMVFFSKSYWQK